VPGAAFQPLDLERQLASEQQTAEYALCEGAYCANRSRSVNQFD